MSGLSAFLSLCCATALWVFFAFALIPSSTPDAGTSTFRPATGMEVLNTFQCHRAETKRVLVRGIEDNFSPDGEERARIHPRLVGQPIERNVPPTDYDNPNPDLEINDYFEVPANIASGVFVIRYRSVGDNTSDNLSIGDGLSRTSILKSTHKTHIANLSRFKSNTAWTVQDQIHFAQFEHLKLQSGESLLQLVRDSSVQQIIDVSVGDDASVDFMGIAYCEQPKERNGLTLYYVPSYSEPSAKIASFDCHPEDGSKARCNPFSGDQPCDTKLPLLCFADRGSRAKPFSEKQYGDLRTRSWSGGDVAATSPIAANSFKSIADADNHCAQTFGKEWRTAEWHLGGKGFGFSAFSRDHNFSGRYWVDVRGQPYATCWSRD